MEYWPSASVILRRVMPVSADVTSTRAPSTPWPSGDVTLPRMMSVVEPTWARAGVPANRVSSAASNGRRMGAIVRIECVAKRETVPRPLDHAGRPVSRL